MDRIRPNPVRWVYYALGGTLSERYRGWVFHDLTARSWVWRHAARATVLLAPLLVGPLFLPAPIELRLSMVVLAAVVGYFYSLSYVEESCAHRLAKHGFPANARVSVRKAERAEEDERQRRAYLARYRPESLVDEDADAR
ncbi:hypothetical protein EV191_10668 [Tamaricihabitans halophyticus]|uniref:DUF5313 family protein n=1 Tax=Tamaricihabitans halophyticus TaxID=1262583 RepID=A0A4R2QS28_9PSEU|nr:DUF5313 family protein [Tamaricihabitans halophyticus]TCP51904.1 hypothetical protein EV191_10668 [Tamaricihabitans halophyticus]